jgi:hypothetical protein
MLGWLANFLAGRPRTPRSRKDLFRTAKRQGWSIARTQKGHYKLCPPEPIHPCVYTSGTPGDVRAVRNLASQLRRSGLDI